MSSVSTQRTGRIQNAFGVAATIVLSAAALAQPGSPQITGGLIRPNGFPDPLVASGPGTMTATGGSGGGSTGGGVFPPIVGLAEATITAGGTAIESTIALSGRASHPNIGVFLDGFTGAASAQEIIFSLSSPVTFSVTNSSTVSNLAVSYAINPVVLRAITGTITGDPTASGSMTEGTYGIRFAIAAGSRSGLNSVIGSNVNYAPFASLPNDFYLFGTLNWQLNMVPAPGAGAAMVLGGMIALRRRR